jgi:hypothetical protein
VFQALVEDQKILPLVCFLLLGEFMPPPLWQSKSDLQNQLFLKCATSRSKICPSSFAATADEISPGEKNGRAIGKTFCTAAMPAGGVVRPRTNPAIRSRVS